MSFSGKLRSVVRQKPIEMNDVHQHGYTSKVKPGKHCNASSLKELSCPS